MGNRAYVIFEDKDSKTFSPAIYLHWNGGPESVYAFLDELDRRGVRADQEYEAARFVQIVGEYFMPDQLSLGVTSGPSSAADLGRWAREDNGLYLVCRAQPRRVRRLWWDWKTDLQTEWPPRKVNAERKGAYQTIADPSQSYGRIGAQLQASAALLTALGNASGPPLADLLAALRRGDATAREPLLAALVELTAARSGTFAQLQLYLPGQRSAVRCRWKETKPPDAGCFNNRQRGGSARPGCKPPGVPPRCPPNRF